MFAFILLGLVVTCSAFWAHEHFLSPRKSTTQGSSDSSEKPSGTQRPNTPQKPPDLPQNEPWQKPAQEPYQGPPQEPALGPPQVIHAPNLPEALPVDQIQSFIPPQPEMTLTELTLPERTLPEMQLPSQISSLPDDVQISSIVDLPSLDQIASVIPTIPPMDRLTITPEWSFGQLKSLKATQPLLKVLLQNQIPTRIPTPLRAKLLPDSQILSARLYKISTPPSTKALSGNQISPGDLTLSVVQKPLPTPTLPYAYKPHTQKSSNDPTLPRIQLQAHRMSPHPKAEIPPFVQESNVGPELLRRILGPQSLSTADAIKWNLAQDKLQHQNYADAADAADDAILQGPGKNNDYD